MSGLPGGLFPGDPHRHPGLLSEVQISGPHVEASMRIPDAMWHDPASCFRDCGESGFVYSGGHDFQYNGTARLPECVVCGESWSEKSSAEPIARTTDPWTSHAGAAEVTASGRRKTQAELCLDVVLTTPGLTAGEIGQRTGLGHVPAQRRLSDLQSAGKVSKGTARQYSGRPQVTWWPSERQGNLL